MPPKSAKAKAPPPKKAQARKAQVAPAKAKTSAKTAAAPTRTDINPAPKRSGKALPAPKAAAVKPVCTLSKKPNASKRPREEEQQTGKESNPEPGQVFRDLMEASDGDPFQALSKALIAKLPCEVAMKLIVSVCGGVNARGRCQLTSPVGGLHKCTATPLILASYHGSVEVVHQLLKQSARVDATGHGEGSYGYARAIHWAAARGHAFIVKALIANNATVDALTKGMHTPLHFAAQGGHFEVAQLLLSSGAKVANAPDHPRWTALHYAADGGHTQIVELLIGNQASINLVLDYTNRTALHLASVKNHIGVVKALLAANADVTLEDYVGDTALIIAAQYGYIEIVKELIAKTENVNKPGKRSGLTVLETIIPNGNVAMVLELLRGNAIAGDCCLHEAAKLESLDIMRALLANGGVAYINSLDREKTTPLHIAARLGNLPMVEELIAHNADVNASNNSKITPLAEAVSRGRLHVVKRLLACTSQVWMAVYYAAQRGDVGLLELVLSHPSADIEERADYGGNFRPIDIAVGCGNLSMVKSLLSHGAKLDKGGTPDEDQPILGINTERVEILRLLIDSGANVGVLDDSGRSALHTAASYCYTESAQLLLENGADVFAVDNNGNTPKDRIGRTVIGHNYDNYDNSCERLLERYERSAAH